MAFKRSTAKGSKYQQKIDAVTLHIAYEGAVDEAEYFAQLSKSIPRQFQALLRLIPVKKSSTASAPSKVYDDLCLHLEAHRVKLNAGSDLAFMVIDRDHHFTGNHQQSTRTAVNACKQRNIDVICSTPSFDLWLLCHYVDISQCSDDYKATALANKKVSADNTFLKLEVSKVRNGESIKALLKHTAQALHNESLLRQNTPDNIMPPTSLQANIGKIIHIMSDHGLPIVTTLK